MAISASLGGIGLWKPLNMDEEDEEGGREIEATVANWNWKR